MSKRANKQKYFLFMGIISIIIAIAIICIAGKERKQNTNVPNEVASLVENYFNAYKNGTEESVVYAYFESDFIRSAYVDSGDKLIDYKIEKVEKINNDLYCYTLLVKTKTSTFYFGDAYQQAYNFVGRIDNKWYYINSVSNIPAEIQTNLDMSKYTYTDENIVDPGDIVGEIMAE